MSDHITDSVGLLAALPSDDPDRRAAEEHVRTCGTCRDALDEGRRLIRLVGAALCCRADGDAGPPGGRAGRGGGLRLISA
jgi:hypothetical protein